VGDEVGPSGLGLGAVAVGAAEGGVADSGGAVGPGVAVGVGLGSGVGEAGVFPHAARTAPRRRDAARRFAFICRRCCGLSRRWDGW